VWPCCVAARQQPSLDGKGKAEKTQRRILYLLKVWVDEYFYDFYDEDQLLEKLIEFLNQTMVKEGGASSALVLHQRILQSIEANVQRALPSPLFAFVSACVRASADAHSPSFAQPNRRWALASRENRCRWSLPRCLG
jgi:hypothetical protein